MVYLLCRTVRELELPSWEAVKLAVARGSGIAAISRFALGLELDVGTLALLDVPRWRLTRTILAVTARDVPLTPPGAGFFRLLQEAFVDRAATAISSRPPHTAAGGESGRSHAPPPSGRHDEEAEKQEVAGDEEGETGSARERVQMCGGEPREPRGEPAPTRERRSSAKMEQP